MTPRIIPISNVFLSFIPLFLIILVFARWKLDWKTLTYASARMLIQLLMIGYFLSYIFKEKSPFWSILIILFMLLVSAWISLHSIRYLRREKYISALVALICGALPVLLLITIFVIPSTRWYDAKFMIPLAGMVFSNAMNVIGLAAERFQNEIKTLNLNKSRQVALSAALIPQINTFLAVGLVSLPGMMTGQILSGVDPLIAVRYQIVIMAMVVGAGGLSAAVFLRREQALSI